LIQILQSSYSDRGRRSIRIHDHRNSKLVVVKVKRDEYQSYLGMLINSETTRNPTIRGNTGAGVKSCIV